MKSLKNEKGAITIIVVITILVAVAFLITTYVIISNKTQAQKEIVSQTKQIYETGESMEETYNSYFNTDSLIPIYTVEQLMTIGKEESNVNINGKYYNFSNSATIIYELMNDLEFTASDYPDELTNDGYWVPMGNKNLTCKFEGNGHTITVNYTDEEDDDYSVIYSKESKYSEPEYDINVTVQDQLGQIISGAVIIVDNAETSFLGEGTISIKRLQETEISAYLGEGYTTPEETITIINPTKIQDIVLTIESI